MIRQMVNSAYRLILDPSVDVTLAAARSILVVKPDNTTLTWAAVLLSAREIYYDVPSATNDVAGRWLFTSSCVIGGQTYIGETKHLEIAPAWAPFENEV
jgi:hypothetical protein